MATKRALLQRANEISKSVEICKDCVRECTKIEEDIKSTLRQAQQITSLFPPIMELLKETGEKSDECRDAIREAMESLRELQQKAEKDGDRAEIAAIAAEIAQVELAYKQEEVFTSMQEVIEKEAALKEQQEEFEKVCKMQEEDDRIWAEAMKELAEYQNEVNSLKSQSASDRSPELLARIAQLEAEIKTYEVTGADYMAEIQRWAETFERTDELVPEILKALNTKLQKQKRENKKQHHLPDQIVKFCKEENLRKQSDLDLEETLRVIKKSIDGKALVLYTKCPHFIEVRFE